MPRGQAVCMDLCLYGRGSNLLALEFSKVRFKEEPTT